MAQEAVNKLAISNAVSGWKLHALAAALAVASSATAADPLLKTELLGLLGRIKAAVDSNALQDPAALRAVTGIEVLEWSEAPDFPRMAFRFALHSGQLDRVVRSETDGPHLHYVLKTPNGQDFIFAFRGVSGIACVTVEEVDAIFGAREIRYVPRGMPTDGAPFSGPRFQASSEYADPGSRLRLMLAYTYSGEDSPVATCLAGLAVVPRS